MKAVSCFFFKQHNEELKCTALHTGQVGTATSTQEMFSSNLDQDMAGCPDLIFFYGFLQFLEANSSIKEKVHDFSL
jgi:hypothetical protein